MEWVAGVEVNDFNGSRLCSSRFHSSRLKMELRQEFRVEKLIFPHKKNWSKWEMIYAKSFYTRNTKGLGFSSPLQKISVLENLHVVKRSQLLMGSCNNPNSSFQNFLNFMDFQQKNFCCVLCNYKKLGCINKKLNQSP